MKRLLLFAGVLVLLAGHGLSGLPAGDKVEPDYYPLKVGTTWHYALEVMGKEVKVKNRIEKAEVIDGKPLSLQYTIVNEQVTATEYLSSTKEGVFRHKVNGVECKPPLCLLKYPVKTGQTWQSEHVSGTEKNTITVKINDFQEVQVPAGKFKALSVRVTNGVHGQGG
jgi:hypothetical protein